jgi:Fe-S oxidoreductase
MAKLKYEFFNHYYKSHPRKLRDYLFGYIGVFAKLGVPFGGLVNQVLDNQAIGGWAKKVLGVAQERSLPKFASPSMQYEIRNRQNSSLITHHSSQTTDHRLLTTVIYLPDPFTRYFEPEIETAAIKVLRAAGMRIISLPILGAGRTLISKGFLDAAKKHAQAVRDEIKKVDPDGQYPVVGAEPSEIYTLKDEYLDFSPEDDEMRSLAKRSWFVDELMLRENLDAEKHILRVVTSIRQEKEQNPLPENSASLAKPKSAKSAKSVDKKISLHGHCYQKARPPADDGLPVGQEATAEMLRAVGYEVEIIPSGCCGMAGSFGYEEEHYQLSMDVGELVLFPEIRQKAVLNENISIAAPGTSCREQILDGTDIIAKHPLVLVAYLLED